MTVAKSRMIIDVFMFLFIWISLTALLSISYFPSKPLTISNVSTFEIVAPRTIIKEDRAATEKARMRACKEVSQVFSIDSTITEKVINDIATTFKLIKRIKHITRDSSEKLSSGKVLGLKKEIPIELSDASYVTLLSLDNDYIKIVLKPSIDSIIREEMDTGVEPESVEIAIKKALEKASSLKMPSENIMVVNDILSKSIKANVVYDWNATAERQKERMAAVKPVTIEIQKGQKIIGRGEIVTPKHIEILEDIGIYRPNIDIKGLFGAAIFIIIMILIVLQYLKQYQPGIFQNERLIFLLCMIVISVVAMSRWSTMISGYLAPIATASLLIAIIFDYRLALLITAFLSLLISIFAMSSAPGAVSFITGTVAVLSVSKVTRRWDLITASLIVTVTNILSTGVFSLISNESITTISINSLVYGGFNGIFSCLIAIGAMLFIENLFSVTSNIRLLELSNPAEPLLQKLLIEAPGTYHHSIIVGNLAEQAAQAIGADPLLARVGAYYHDVGKLKRPYFFIENQFGSENPHDKLGPSLSALIIISHVKDGLELAKQYKLPEPISNIIIEHHGNALVAYFFHQAKMKSSQPVNETDFRYHGPKPQSKEAAIIMISDFIEAAARSLSQPNFNKIENLVNKIVEDILRDGQLDECELSFKNISDLKRSFIKTVKGMYHTRIEYPTKIDRDITDATKMKKLYAPPQKG